MDLQRGRPAVSSASHPFRIALRPSDRILLPISSWISFQRPVCNPCRVETTSLQLSPAKKRLCIRNLKNPRTCTTLRAVKEVRFAVDVQKHFLEEILGFLAVTQDSAPNAMNYPSIAEKKVRHGL